MQSAAFLSRSLKRNCSENVDNCKKGGFNLWRFVDLCTSRFASSVEDKNRLNKLLVCHILAFFYAAGNSIKHAAFPYLIRELHITKQQYGYLLSAFSLGQLLGAPIYGHFSDVVGVRSALCVSFICSAAVVLGFSLSRGLLSLFASCIPSIALHGMQVIYMVVADSSDVNQRADMLGKLSLSYGTGTILGSLCGGEFTEKFGSRAASVLSAVVFSICLGMAFVFVPSSSVSHGNSRCGDEADDPACQHATELHDFDASAKKGKRVTIGSLCSEVVKVLKYDGMFYVVSIRVVTTFPILIFHSMTPLLLIESFRLRPKALGKLSAFLGIIAMVIQGFVVGQLSKRMADANIIFLSAFSLAVGFLFLTVTHHIYFFCGVATVLAFGASLCHVIITSVATKIAAPEDNGVAIALAMSTPHALVATFAPTLGGFIFSRFGFPAFGLLGYVVHSAVTFYLFVFGRKQFISPEN